MRWQDINRSSATQVLTEIRWGYTVIPIDAAFNLANIDVDRNAISTEECDVLNLALDMEVTDFSIFVRVRFRAAPLPVITVE